MYTGAYKLERAPKHQLQLAKSRIKVKVDKKRSHTKFQVGELDYVRLRPYRQESMRGQSYHKLIPKNFGPFKVVKKVGTFPYQSELPSQAKIHSNFHVSQ